MAADAATGAPPWLTEQVRLLCDRAALSDLIDRYLLALDQGAFDAPAARGVFTADAALSFPPGDHHGLAGLVAFTQDFMRHWARTHHQCSNYAIDVAGDRASIGWNVIATHVHHGSPPPPAQGHYFQLGGRFEGTALRTSGGWRIQSLALRVLWTAGTGIQSIAAIMAGARESQ